MALKNDGSEYFNSLTDKINNLFFGRTIKDEKVVETILDELNSINYRCAVVTSETKAVLLINQCCTLVTSDNAVLIQKCSRIIKSLVNNQHINVEGRTLTIAVQWCLNGLESKNPEVTVDILKALDALLRKKTSDVTMLIESVIKELKHFMENQDNLSSEVILSCLHCLEAATTQTENSDCKGPHKLDNSYELCGEIFTFYLCKGIDKIEDPIKSKITCVCLIGVQNIVIYHNSYIRQEIGNILGIVKIYMLYCIRGVDFSPPQKLLPSVLSIPETSVVRETKGGKLTKQRKHRTSGIHKKDQTPVADISLETRLSGYTPASTSFGYNSDSGANFSLDNVANRLKTSDSDFSDNEVGKYAAGRQVQAVQARVRLAALNLLYNIVKNSEKPVIFSYWTSFIPESSLFGNHNLITCILKDPSSKCRMSALNVLLLLLTSAKLYLVQASSSEKSSSFTPFSVTIGLMVKEIHKGLCLALRDMSVPVLIQVLKCLSALVQATPYHKMSPGLITKIVRNVKPFIYYKDASVQVTALIVLGCVLAFEPVLSETQEAMLKLQQTKEKEENVNKEIDNENFDYAEFSDSDSEIAGEDVSIPWLLKRCLTNLGVEIDTEEIPEKQKQTASTVAAPVKVESLQVLSAMSRNYFELLMVPHMSFITKAIQTSFADKYIDMTLHAGRAVDFIGQAINTYISSEETKNRVSLQHFLSFWNSLLDGPLVDLVQCEEHPPLRAVGCDCFGSIGPNIFEQLQRNKHILCVTLLFSCARDNEKSVKAAAIRALAMCVLYPSLREDPGFVVDTAEAICRAYEDENVLVRIKTSWSLGNLSDALVLNSKNQDVEEIPESLLLKLLQTAVEGATDCDKIKMNAVRAIGNLLQLITNDLVLKPTFVQTVDGCFCALIRNCTSGSNMKVRWNACYALGNAMKNNCLYHDESNVPISWQESVFKALMDLVVGFKNLKVRINAALALSSPRQRNHYGRFFIPVWISLLKALENSQNIEDFNEYKHRDNLIEQVCLSLCHLTTLITKEDLTSLYDAIHLYTDIFTNHIKTLSDRLVPEKSNVLCSAFYALKELDSVNLTNNEREVNQFLMEIFTLNIND